MESHLEIQRLLSQSSAQLRELKAILAALDRQTFRKGDFSHFHTQRTALNAQILLEETTRTAISKRNEKIQQAIDLVQRTTGLNPAPIPPFRVLPKSPLPLMQNSAVFLRKAIQMFEISLGMRLESGQEGVKIVFFLSESCEVWAILQEKAGVFRLSRTFPDLQDIGPVVERLNCTNDLVEFVSSLRRAFLGLFRQ